MSAQLRASFKKEILAFTRTKKAFILALVFVGIAALYPLLIQGTYSMMAAMSDMYGEMGIDVSGLGDTESGMHTMASFGLQQALAFIASAGLLIYLILINSFAGGEQKKRSVIIPRSAGLNCFNYLFPKFIIYPLAALILSIIGALIGGAVSSYAFTNNDLDFNKVFASGALLGVYLMLYVCLHLSLGTATGRAGLSSAACIFAALILPDLFYILHSAEYVYNPFALSLLAATMGQGAEVDADVVITVVIALAIMVAVFFAALFAQNARKVDNSGDEILI